MERIKLNLIPSGVAPIVHLSQYDDGRKFGIDLFEGESVYVLDGTETLTVNSRKPDGHVVVISVTNTGTSSLDVDTVEQLTAVHGVSYAKLKIEKGSVTIATLPFLIDVSRDPLENGDPSESFVDNLNTQIASAVSEQYDSSNVIFDPTPTQGHGTGFAVTSEGVKNAIDGIAIPDELNDLSDVTITTPTNGEILVYNNGSWENQANPASTTNFAPDYDDTATYNTNDKVIYQGLLYVCLEDSVTGAWDNTKWQNISVADLNAELLPIQSGSATNTKDYIDTALSGKADSSDTYTKTEVDNIVDARKCSTYSIITLDTLTSTEQTFNTYGGRKFSDYDLYIFAFGSSDKNFRRTVVLTKSQWQSGANIDEGVLHGASTSTASSYDYCGIVVNYNTDTSIKAKVFGSGSINKFSVIGIKY